MRGFRTWAEVDAYVRRIGIRDQSADALLVPILQTRTSESASERWAVLLLLFWRSLEGVHVLKRRWDQDAETLWANIQWCFLETVHRLDLTIRTERLGQKITNDTIHRLHDVYRTEWDREKREPATDPEDLTTAADPRPGVDFDAIELRQVQETETKRLRALVDLGQITEAEFFLLLGTRIYGRPLREYARKFGLDYEVAKKRRQRAEAKIGGYGKRA